MKIRNGFVANSSSSSFLILADRKSSNKVTLRVDMVYEASREYTSAKSFESDYDCNDTFYNTEMNKKALEHIKAGGKVLVCRTDSDGCPDEQFLYNYGGEVEILDADKIFVTGEKKGRTNED